MEDILHVCFAWIAIVEEGRLEVVSRVWGCEFTDWLYMFHALRLIDVHWINDKLEGAATLVPRKFEEKDVFYVCWFVAGKAESFL